MLCFCARALLVLQGRGASTARGYPAIKNAAHRAAFLTFPGAERTSRRLGAGLVAQAKREDGAVVLDGAALLEALKDLLAHGVELLAVVDLSLIHIYSR